MTTLLLITKLGIPPARLALVSRPRLIEGLDAGLLRAPGVTLISAPAGYGKTTLLSAWLHTLIALPPSPFQGEGPGVRVAWLSLDEGDNDRPRLLAYLVAALQGVQAGIGEPLLAALQPAGMPGAPQPATETLLTGLINEIAAVPARLVLVLDDYHLITAQPIHDALAFLIDHLPGNLYLVIATRADPPLPIARLRARGQLTELRQADLRFTPDEAAEFLRRVMGLPLSTGDVTALASRTEGWIAGLQLAALSMRGLDDVGTFVQAFAGSDRYVLDYLAEEVLQRQPAHVQAFLLQTSVLDRLTGPLCEAVRFGYAETLSSSFGTAVLREQKPGIGERLDSAPRMLEHLEHENLFITSLDNRREWYRYHRLWADLLRKRLHDQVGPQGTATLHRRASAWYEGHDLLEEAIRHALAAGDMARAAGLVEQAAETTLMRSEIATFLGWVEALPDEAVRARPLLCAWHAGALLLNGSPLEVVEARLRDAGEGDAGAPVGAAVVFRGLIAVVQGDRESGIELARQALALLPAESAFLRGMAANTLGMAHVLAGDTDAAIQAFEEAARIAERGGNVMFAVAALCNLAGLAVDRGQLHRAAAGYRRALELATDAQGQGRRWPVASRALLGLGALAQEWNDLDAAARHFQEGLELSKQYAEIGALFCCLHLARVRQMQGDVDSAEDLLLQARRIAVQYDATEMDDRLVDLAQVRVWLAQGNVAAAARWADDTTASVLALPELREGEDLTRARVRLAQSRGDDALTLLEPLLHAAEKRGRMRRVVELLALHALAFQSQGDAEGALAPLARSLTLAEPEGYIRTFVDEGPPMATLLRQAAMRGIAPAYVGQLLAAFEASEPETIPTQPLVEPLSERELEVLGLIAQGLSNREIAGRLVISLSTVKGHTANIYGKLGVNSRTQAVAQARALGILSGS
ncbi:MAG: LuxR C-terminal-related transcriptional regulator [Chloroflexi bacterium]|nr:LuxR C-terminal-related transcriptional regulator [Chloroflexota bacterium]MBU1749555.1 LuxR C-terminal-related transcriptional regulator [Chloroflexota bacterium]